MISQQIIIIYISKRLDHGVRSVEVSKYDIILQIHFKNLSHNQTTSADIIGAITANLSFNSNILIFENGTIVAINSTAKVTVPVAYNLCIR